MTKYKFAYHVDKLEVTYYLSMSLKSTLEKVEENKNIEINGYKFTRIKSRTYEYTYQVGTIFDTILGTFFFGSNNTNRSDMYLYVDNRILYEGLSFIYDFEKCVKLYFKQISKLDICLDTEKKIINRFYSSLHDPDLTFVINGKKITDRTKRLTNLLHMSTGSMKNIRIDKALVIHGNNISCRAYNKGLEVEESSRKDYIRETLDMNDIYRFEVSFSNHRSLLDQLKCASTLLSEKELYNGLSDEGVLGELFNNAMYRMIHLAPSTSLIDYLLFTKRKYKKRSL